MTHVGSPPADAVLARPLGELSEAGVLALSAEAGDPDWLRDRRQEAFKAFNDLAWPHNRMEEWRYTDPRRFDLTHAVSASAAPGAPEPAGGVSAAVRHRLAGALRIVDGAVVSATVAPQAAAQGVAVGDLSTAAGEHADVVGRHLGSAVGSDEKFDALNLAAFTGSALVWVPADVELTDPLAVTIQVETDGAYLPRVLVVLGAHAKATVYVDHVGGAAATVVEAVEVIVGEGAQAQLVTAQDWAGSVDHIASHRGLVGANGDYRHLEVTMGGRTVYIRPDVLLDHPGGRAELLGVYFCSGEQRVEHRSLIHHNASQTTSELVYKGALQDHSKATFFGNIRIEQHARATASDQTNRNLILTDGSRADSIPFLEIENSEVVRCGHHSSVGQVDELQLFYLESRGIPRDEAVRLLVFGFFAEVTDRIDLPGVTETVLAEIEREIRGGLPAPEPLGAGRSS